jgi:Flp pilus assembly protein TadB
MNEWRDAVLLLAGLAVSGFAVWGIRSSRYKEIYARSTERVTKNPKHQARYDRSRLRLSGSDIEEAADKSRGVLLGAVFALGLFVAVLSGIALVQAAT